MNNPVNNMEIVSTEEEKISSFLRKKNLARTNRISEKVYPKVSFYTKYGKRILDVCITAPTIVLLSPIYLCLSIGTYLSVGKPIMYRQTRTGLNEKPFNMIKFRGMTNEKDEKGQLLPVAQRLTSFGKFIRKYSLDELPSLFNILMGDMSIIGPRPFPIFFKDRMSDRHRQRCRVRPGLECPRVIDVDGELYQKQFENDIWYVEHISFLCDIKLLLLLIKMTFSIKQRSYNAQGGDYFVGYDDNGKALYKGIALKMYKKMMDEVNAYQTH